VARYCGVSRLGIATAFLACFLSESNGEQPARTIHIENRSRVGPTSSTKAAACSISIARIATAPTPCRGNGRGICGGLTFAMEKRHRPFFTRPSARDG